MISRCPSCGTAAPDEALTCPACDWDFVANKKTAKNQAPPLDALAPAKSIPVPTPAVGPEKTSLSQVKAEGPAPANSFALPIARNSGPRLSESLLTSAPSELAIPKAKGIVSSGTKIPPRKIDTPQPALKREVPRPQGRRLAIYLAILVGLALGLLSFGAIILTLRSEPKEGAPPTGASPFGKRSAEDVTTRLNSAPAAAPVAAPLPVARETETSPAATPAPSSIPEWVFEGFVYDILSTQGVFGARLAFIDSQNNEVASLTTTEDGHYLATMKPGPAEGYTVRITHNDYAEKYIAEPSSTSSLRKAGLEARKALLAAGAHSLPWIGAVAKSVRHDLALVPKTAPD